MAMTPLTSASSYASAADLLNVYDARKIGHWCTDGETKIPPGQLLTDTVVAAALLRASGVVESKAIRGKKYTPSDLAALTGAGQAFLKGLVCDLAAYYLARRRIPDAEKYTNYEETAKTLDGLEKGEAIFSFQEIADAGNMDSFDTSLDSSDLLQRPTELAKRFFGQRSDSFTNNPIPGIS